MTRAELTAEQSQLVHPAKEHGAAKQVDRRDKRRRQGHNVLRRRNMRIACVSILAALIACPAQLPAAEWGNLTMRFVYDGEPPAPRLLKGPEGREIADDTLIIHPKNQGVANVCIWLSSEGGDSPPVHPDYALVSSDRFAGTIRNGRLGPHIMIVRPPQSFVVRNDDSVGYSALIDFPLNGSLNWTLREGETNARLLEREESRPARLTCAIHPWLNGYVLVQRTPYCVVSDENGRATFKNLPAGKWTFIVWHEKSGYIKQAQRGGKRVEWPRGRLALDIKAGENDLGELKIKP